MSTAKGKHVGGRSRRRNKRHNLRSSARSLPDVMKGARSEDHDGLSQSSEGIFVERMFTPIHGEHSQNVRTDIKYDFFLKKENERSKTEYRPKGKNFDAEVRPPYRKPPPLPKSLGTTFEGEDRYGRRTERDWENSNDDDVNERMNISKRQGKVQQRIDAMKSHCMILALPLSEFEMEIDEQVNERVDATLISNIPGYMIVIAIPDKPKKVSTVNTGREPEDWLHEEDLDSAIASISCTSMNNLDEDHLSEIEELNDGSTVYEWTYIYRTIPEYTRWSNNERADYDFRLNIPNPENVA